MSCLYKTTLGATVTSDERGREELLTFCEAYVHVKRWPHVTISDSFKTISRDYFISRPYLSVTLVRIRWFLLFWEAAGQSEQPIIWFLSAVLNLAINFTTWTAGNLYTWGIHFSAIWHCAIGQMFPGVSRQRIGLFLQGRNVQKEDKLAQPLLFSSTFLILHQTKAPTETKI